MSVSTKEQIQAEAMKSHRTVEVSIGSSTATLRELSQVEREALDKSNYKIKADGEFETRVDPKDSESYLVLVEEKKSRHMERWIAATISPAFTVEEIAAWPLSLRRRICEAAKSVNGIETAAATAKNS